MNKEIVAVDVDEVLFPFLDAFIAHHNYNYGTTLHRSDFHSYEFDKNLDITTPEAVRRVYDFLESLADTDIAPISDSQQSIARLSTKFDLAVITARHPKFESSTLNWLTRYFPDLIGSVTAIGYAPIMEKPQTKAEICQRLGASALIDDSVVHIQEASNEGIRGILFGDYAWNRLASLPPKATRCPTWRTVLENFDL